MANKKLIMENYGDMEATIHGLLHSGYEINITPIYSEAKNERGYRRKPFAEKFAVEVGDKIEAPKVEDEEKIPY